MSKSSDVTRRTAIRVAIAGAAGVAAGAEPASGQGTSEMERVEGIGGQPRERGITVELDPEVYPNGRFARLSDPEGNPIQLWQPGGKDRG